MRSRHPGPSALRRTGDLDAARQRHLDGAEASKKAGRPVVQAISSDLEACLQVFRNDPAHSATVLSSLAGLFSQQGDVAQAIIQERRALALREQLPDPRDRAVSHHNLANDLERSGTPSALAESSRHRLAALMYCLVAGLRQDLQTFLGNYVILFRRAQAAGTPLSVPRVAELLADPAFRPLADWLRQHQADVAEVQAAVDEALAMARQVALGPK